MRLDARLARAWMALLILACSGSAVAANYALLMNISDYPPLGVQDETDLPGTPADMKAFREYAIKRLNVPENNILMLQERKVSRANVVAAIRQLMGRATESDHVIIVYSGHGAQVFDPNSKKANQCSEGIVTIEGEKAGFLPDHELRPLLDALSDKAGKVIVFFDSCFSGGAITVRSLSNYRPKFYQKGASSGNCGTAVNTRGLARSMTEGKHNLVYIAAAAHNEVAMDAGEKEGGLATGAWMKCLRDGAADTDKSGAITAEELVACAQQRINALSSSGQRVEPIQHVTLEGSRGVVLTFNDAAPETEIRPTPPKPVAEPAPISAPVPALIPMAPAATDAPMAATAALMDLYASRNPKWEVSLKSAKTSYKINTDKVELSITSARAGYVYLMMVGTDNEGGYLLFPNDFDQGNAIKANQTLSLPRRGLWQIRPGGPAGTDRMVALVADGPLDLGKSGMTKSYIFKKSGNRPLDLAKLQRAFVSGGTRTLMVAKAADDISYNYGAALLEIQEVK